MRITGAEPVIAPGKTTTPGALATSRSPRLVTGVVSTLALTSPNVVTALPSSLLACCPVAVLSISLCLPPRRGGVPFELTRRNLRAALHEAGYGLEEH